MASVRSRMWLFNRARRCLRRVSQSRRDGTGVLSNSALRASACDLSTMRRSISGWFLFVGPKTSTNEAGAVREEFEFRDDVTVFLDFSELPDFEVVRCLADRVLVTLAPWLVDALGHCGQDLFVSWCAEWRGVVVDHPVADGVDVEFHFGSSFGLLVLS